MPCPLSPALHDQVPPPPWLSEVVSRLLGTYHPDPPLPRPERRVLDALIRTLLSQQNTSTMAERQFGALRTAYPRWEAALLDGPEGIAEVLRAAGGGLARIKAGYIHGILTHLEAALGTLDLGAVRGLDDAGARRLLEALPGVGMKTASLVLLFDLLRPALPVDSNIERVAKRLELVPPRWNAQKVEHWFDAVVARDWAVRAAFHVAGVRHGRLTCRPRNPRCDRCVLRDLCPSAALLGPVASLARSGHVSSDHDGAQSDPED
ncbi:endonuclease III domain-containing protein [Deinococcus navajonensis]|uniref:Endonuclease III domain-containing protein n=1 Tax=Deinococcus navajonensis TaxID=309884 RepID=A0ABV8XLM8_9DEIO